MGVNVPHVRHSSISSSAISVDYSLLRFFRFMTGLWPPSFFGTRNRVETNPPSGTSANSCTAPFEINSEISCSTSCFCNSLSWAECGLLAWWGWDVKVMSWPLTVFRTHRSFASICQFWQKRPAGFVWMLNGAMPIAAIMLWVWDIFTNLWYKSNVVQHCVCNGGSAG